MKYHNNYLSLILSLAMLFTILSGCGAKVDNPTDEVSITETESTTENSPAEAPKSDIPADYASFSYSDGIDENGFFKGVTALDYIENFNYKSLPVPANIHQVPEESVQAEIDGMLSSYSTNEQITNRAIVNGDTVNIDYVGSVDGVPFDGGSTNGAGTDVTIGVTSYIDDFLEQLIGHMPGETINIEVTFPDVYQEESLQGKEAVFVTVINHIVDKKQAELTDDFVKTNFFNSNGWETIAGMKQGVSEQLKTAAIGNYIADYLFNGVTLRSMPDTLTDYQEKAMLRYYLDGAESYNMEFDEFLSSYVGISGGVDELIESNRDKNLQNATYALIMQAVAEDARLSVSEDDLTDFFTDYSQYEEQYGLPYLKQTVLIDKAFDYVIDNSVLE